MSERNKPVFEAKPRWPSSMSETCHIFYFDKFSIEIAIVEFKLYQQTLGHARLRAISRIKTRYF